MNAAFGSQGNIGRTFLQTPAVSLDALCGVLTMKATPMITIALISKVRYEQPLHNALTAPVSFLFVVSRKSSYVAL